MCMEKRWQRACHKILLACWLQAATASAVIDRQHTHPQAARRRADGRRFVIRSRPRERSTTGVDVYTSRIAHKFRREHSAHNRPCLGADSHTKRGGGNESGHQEHPFCRAWPDSDHLPGSPCRNCCPPVRTTGAEGGPTGCEQGLKLSFRRYLPTKVGIHVRRLVPTIQLVRTHAP